MANVPEHRDIPRLKDASTSPNMDAYALLPTTAGTTYTHATGALDLSSLFPTAKGAMLADAEIAIRVPNMLTAEMNNGDTLKISVLLDINSTIDGASIVYMLDVIDLLGAGGIGDLGEEIRIKIPSKGFIVNIAGVTVRYDYVGVSCIHTGAGDPADVAKRCYVDLVF